MGVILWFCLMLAELKPGFTELSWNRWPLYKPQKPVEYAYRRNQEMPLEGPIFQHCQCPPHEDCKIDFKLNEDALDQLELRGIITQEDAQELKASNKQDPLEKLPRRMRRFNAEINDDECCCPPRTIMMPTIITEKQFNETIERFNNIVAR